MFSVTCNHNYFNIKKTDANSGQTNILRIYYTKDTGVVISKPLDAYHLSLFVHHYGMILGSGDNGITYVCSLYSSGPSFESIQEWGDYIKHTQYIENTVELAPKIANMLNNVNTYNPIFRNCVDFVRPLKPNLIIYEYFVFFVAVIYIFIYFLLLSNVLYFFYKGRNK